MWPTLFEIPLPEFLQNFLKSLLGQDVHSIPIRSFGVMVMLGFLIGLWYAMRLAKRFGTEPEKDPGRVSDLAFWLLLSIILGGRLFYVAQNLNQFSDSPFRIFAFWEGGLVFYGGFIACIVVGLIQTKKLQLDTWNTADFMLVAGMVGYGIGRWGCFLVGDDYGSETTVPWAIHVPDPLPKDSLFMDVQGHSLAGKYLHPAQLYMSANGFIIAAIGRWLFSRRKFKGQVCWTVILLYAIGRFIIEFFRGDEDRGFYGPLSTSQWVGIVMALISLGMMKLLSGKRELQLSRS